MNNQTLTAAELLMVQEQLRGAIAGARFLNHCANETNDQQFKQLCQQVARDKQNEVQQFSSVLGTVGANTIQ